MAIYSGTLIDSDDLEDALSPNTMLQLFNDDRSGSPNERPLKSVIKRAEAMVYSYLFRMTGSATIPQSLATEIWLLKQAALNWAIPYSYLRHGEYVRTFGENPKTNPLLKQADEMMERLCTGKQAAPELAALNQGDGFADVVGGVTVDNGPRTMTDSPDGTVNTGDF